MIISQDVRGLLEILYFISGPLLVIVSGFGLYNLKIAKDDLMVRCKREAASLAAAQCLRFSNEIIPLINAFDKELKNNVFLEYKGIVRKFHFDAVKSDLDSTTIAKAVDFIRTSENLANTLNALESFAVYFTEGVADEAIAFSSVGSTFCFTVKRYYVILCFLRNKPGSNHYEDLVKLYEIWSSRMKRHDLENRAKQIEVELTSLKPGQIKPIGS